MAAMTGTQAERTIASPRATSLTSEIARLNERLVRIAAIAQDLEERVWGAKPSDPNKTPPCSYGGLLGELEIAHGTVGAIEQALESAHAGHGARNTEGMRDLVDKITSGPLGQIEGAGGYHRR